MDPQKSTKGKLKKRNKLSKSRGASDSSNDSSPDDNKSDDESHNIHSSRIQLVKDKRKSSSSTKSGSRSSAKSDNSDKTIINIESKRTNIPQVTKESISGSSLAQSIKKRFGFFRKSENKSSDIESSIEIDKHQTMDVVVDVHCENESDRNKSKSVKKTVASKKSVSNKSDDDNDNDEEEESNEEDKETKGSLDLIEEFKDDKKRRGSKNLLNSESETEAAAVVGTSSKPDRSNDELPIDTQPTSGLESPHRRRRWDKSEITAEELVEDLRRPRRRQWAKGTASAKLQKTRGSSAVETVKPVRPRSSLPVKPVAAPRLKSFPGEKRNQAYDNEAFSSDHDEILRIETINNSSPKIKIGGSVDDKKNKNKNLDSSDEEEEDKKSVGDKRLSIDKKRILETGANMKKRNSGSTSESPNLSDKKVNSKKRSNGKRKISVDTTKSVDEGEEDEELEEDEEDQETVLNVMEKKSRRSSSSSKIEIIPSNFFERASSDETTISTNEEMHTPKKSSRRSSSKSKSKSSKSSKSSRSSKGEEASEHSSHSKRKTSSSRPNSNEESTSTKRKAKSKKKKRSKKKEKDQKNEDEVEEEEEEEEEQELKYISVRIHRADMLEADYITKNPMVRVHIVYADTGDYLKVHGEEETEDKLLLPLITNKFDLRAKRTMVPVWEEELIFEQRFQCLFGDKKKSVLLLFEIIDLLSSAETGLTSDQYHKDNCWHKVAWAFLRPVGVSGIRHVDKTVRLQLYRARKPFRKTNQNKCEVYRWWKSSNRDEYPSSLYVTVFAVDPPILEPVFYEQPLEPPIEVPETHSESGNVQSPGRTIDSITEPGPKWTRLAAQSCQIPNDISFETETSDNGCFYLAFSNDGKYLACAISDEYDFPIVVYKIDEEKVHVRFAGHKNFIYSLHWSHDDNYLLSTSSDQTARLWDVREKIIEHIYSLPHPSYVYCGQFTPNSSSYIVTGCYDHIARVWARIRSTDTNNQYELVQELEAHESFVNTICFQSKEECCLTGDGLGVIVVWQIKRNKRSPVRREWQIVRKIKIKETDAVPINTILLHPHSSRLLIHTRNGGLRLIDTAGGSTVKSFEGLKNQRIQIKSCISPCGGLLFCGGEDSSLNVWSIDSGKLLASYEINNANNKAVTCVDYHPYDHVLAYSVYGAPVAVKILKFDREADGKNVGLKWLAISSAASLSSRLKDHPLMRNGMRNLELSARGLAATMNMGQEPIGSLLADYKDDDEARRKLKNKMQKFMESGPNLKAKSMTRLNGIIEKIDRILMYATSQKSPAVDLESARQGLEDQQSCEMMEMKDLSVESRKTERRPPRRHRHRSKSARNACSPSPKEIDFSKAFSDSAAFTRKVSRFSDDSSNSNRSVLHERFVVERLDLERIEHLESESGFKDSLDTIIDGKEDFPSEELIDIESLKSDDTYVVNKEKAWPATTATTERNDDSDKSNATFIIESEIPPVPKPRKSRPQRIQVM